MTDKKTSVLILDDEPIVSKRLKPSLEKKGYEVETFTVSLDALKRIRERDFDIVITDLKMEGLSGMEFMSEVKSHSPSTEVIIITGFATMDTAKESFSKGVFDFLAKPFKLGEIAEVIKRAEEKSRK
ncbi:MAG: response regulator [Deltaproteobacteria bacterium]|nr:response regulator [Deltaproteobacteria bacterium]MBW2659513.1 response regulator [Deltaproteobacteria bacterium]